MGGCSNSSTIETVSGHPDRDFFRYLYFPTDPKLRQHASLIKNNSARQKYLDKSFDNGMKRHLCYRNFLAVVNRGQPLGRGVRVILPRCVISKIRQQYPDNNGLYTGCQPAHDHDWDYVYVIIFLTLFHTLRQRR